MNHLKRMIGPYIIVASIAVLVIYLIRYILMKVEENSIGYGI